jgi:hypothetical protein
MITNLDRRAGLCARRNPAPPILKHAAIVGVKAIIRTKGDKTADRFGYVRCSQIVCFAFGKVMNIEVLYA